MEDNDLLKQAIKARDNFLKEYPELRDYQKNLDLSLSTLSDPIDRVCAIIGKISNNMGEIGRLAKDIQDIQDIENKNL
jgi:hypothetical protein